MDSPDEPLGLIAGTSLIASPFFDDLDERTVETDFEPVTVQRTDRLVALRRHHSTGNYRPPHRINHHAHVDALDHLGVSTVVAVQSVGSLTEEIPPGKFLVPDDYMNPWSVVTFHDDEAGHGVRQFDESLRDRLLGISNEGDVVVEDGGVYAQTRGPRFETPAEATMLADYADVVGMTAASELILCDERSIDYASLCSVDNYVNGIEGTEISMESFQESVTKHEPIVRDLVIDILKEFGVTR